jgi:hypothetical protein
MSMKKIVQGMVVFVIGVGAFFGMLFLIPLVFMLLWNDMTPHFGINIPLTWWQVVKLFILVSGIRWMVFGDHKGIQIKVKDTLRK